MKSIALKIPAVCLTIGLFVGCSDDTQTTSSRNPSSATSADQNATGTPKVNATSKPKVTGTATPTSAAATGTATATSTMIAATPTATSTLPPGVTPSPSPTPTRTPTSPPGVTPSPTPTRTATSVPNDGNCVDLTETSSHPSSVVAVAPRGETAPVASSGDAADDTAFWVDPDDSSRSLIIGTDKKAALHVYDLSGADLQTLPVGAVNNVETKYGFRLNNQTVDIVAASHADNNTILVWRVDSAARRLVQVGTIAVGLTDVYGFTMYKSKVTGDFFAIVNTKAGIVRQFKLTDAGNGSITGQSVREFDVGTQVEGMAADDEAATLYVGEETVGIWRYGAEPNAGTARFQVDKTASGGHIAADVEGLAIYFSSNGTGYLIASSQGNSRYTVYRREGNNAYIGAFSIGNGAGGIDGTTGTDGIDVINMPLGNNYPSGMFVAQDTTNTGGMQNFKLVGWDSIAEALGLKIDTGYDVRTSSYNCRN